MVDIYTNEMYYKFETEVCDSFNYKLQCVRETDNHCVYQIQRKKLAASKVREIVYDKDLDLVSCSCKKFESAGIPCTHIISYLMKFDAEILPDKYILKRWTKTAKSGTVVDNKGMQITSDNSYLLTWSQFIQSSLDLVDKSLVCEETRTMFTDGLRSINEQISQFLSSRMAVMSFTEKSNSIGSNIIGDGDGTSAHGSCQNSFNEPDQVRAKGCGKRLKGGKEKAMARIKNKRERRCHGCGKVGQSHDKRNCPALKSIEAIFEGKACADMRGASLSLTRRLAQTAQETFGDFEEAVEKDATKTSVQDGTVHPLTSYVINYVKFLFDYQSTLKQLFQEFETEENSNSQLAIVTMRIMQALQSNLDGKSKQYRDPALTHLFLMNNIHYMVRSVRRSEAKDLLGDDWVQRHRRVVQQNANQYKRVAWAKILQSLSAQGLTSSGGGSAVGGDGSSSSGVSRSAIKERFKSFNVQFEELHQRQTQWTVPDPELRESLRLAVAEVLLPAYRSFIKRFGPLVEGGKNPQKYIKYTAEDLDRMLGEFFEGRATGASE
ncbi:exocyst complex component EXO70A1-like [Asparagus officinalis]|uniref:exocyst complex component EXO70A1-like n=1 Tax=Asparagus officinalis TaxID=4686 RepID=UPI00098E1980|nr:exocyst complex component EXO70A1-like [Asparagus officinalis]